MTSKTIDLTGWLLAAATVMLAAYIGIALGGRIGSAIASALVILVTIERRRSKVITASLIRIADSAGNIRGLIAWNGEGIQIGVRSDALHNNAVGCSTLWQKEPSVSFTFRPTKTIANGSEDHTPTMGVSGLMAGKWRTYAMEFSYKSMKLEPTMYVSEQKSDGIFIQHIHLQ